MHKKINPGSLISGLTVLAILAFPVKAFSDSVNVQVIVSPKAYIFADGNPMTLKPIGKARIMMDSGIHVIAAEVDGYHMETKEVEIISGGKVTITLALIKRGQNRDATSSIRGGEIGMGVNQDRADWILKRIGGKSEEYASAVPSHQVKLKDYKIDKYEVSNEQYQKFVTATKHKLPKSWKSSNVPIDIANYPVVNVSYADADAYCKWKGKRLPTEAEWEYAARGDSRNIFPWGKKYRDARANLRASNYRSPTDTGRYEKGVSSFSDCYEMSGNVWEWTSSWYDAYPGSKHKDTDFGKSMKVIRGGSFREGPSRATAVLREKLLPNAVQDNVGFRCAK